MTTTTASTASTYNPGAENLRSLLWMRTFALIGQSLILLYVLTTSGTFDGLRGVAASLLVLGTLTALSLRRSYGPWPVTDNEFLMQLLLDVIGWSVLMYFTGGANNPFVSYFIVPVVIAAAVLPRAYTWSLALCAGSIYGLLLFYYQPFPVFSPHSGMDHAGMGHGSNTGHVVGMWFNFLVSVGLIAFFVVRMAQTMQRQKQRLAEQREDRLRDDQILAVASLAAGTAHELGTPLSTMAVLLDEMLSDPSLNTQARQDCELLKAQVQQCKSTMSALTRTAELDGAHQRQLVPVGEFVHDVMERWRVRRPNVNYAFHCAEGSPALALDTTLAQAIENLLNNAADSGTDRVALTVTWDSESVAIQVRDWGKGIAPEQMATLGKPVVHANRTGLGIGLMLSQATVERYHGTLKLVNHEEGGVLATLQIPLLENQTP